MKLLKYEKFLTILKWLLISLLTVKTLATVFMFSGSNAFDLLFPCGLTTIPFSIAYLLSVDKVNILIFFLTFIVAPLCHIAGFLLIFFCKRKTFIPAVILTLASCSDIICMLASISQATGLITGKVVSIAFNLLILILLVIYTVTSQKQTRYK